MDMFEQAFAAAAEVSSDENWTRLQKYEEKEYYSATDVEINLDERTIGDLSGNVSTLGEDNSQYIQFIMDRYADGVDLTTMLIQVQYKLESGQESVSAPVNAYASESRIRFGWPISRIATQKEQTIQFIVFCTGNREDGEPYVLKTKPINYKIEFTLGIGGTIITPDEDWFLQFENVMNEKLNQVAGLTEDAIDSAAGAKESEQNAAQSASTASTLASQVQSNTVQAKASADAAKVSEQNAKASEDAARVYAGNASAVANVQIGTSDTAGLLRGGDIHVDESGALKIITPTTEKTMPNSYDGRLLVEEIRGVTEQESTTGKNLLDCSGLTAQTVNGVTFTPVYENGLLQYINVNGTATANAYYTLSTDFTEWNGSLIINGGINESAQVYISDANASEVYRSKGGDVQFTANNFMAKAVVLIASGYTANNLKFYPMIRLASVTDATYEPFTNGPAPNSSYPQEIKKTVVSEIKTHGKNFYNPNTHTIGGTTLAIMGGSKADSLDAELIKSGEYTISYNCDKNVSLYVVDYNKNNVIVNGTVKKSVTFAIPNDTKVNIWLYSSTGVNDITDIQLEEGTVATAYEPYTESVITLSEPIDLNGKGDVQDVIEDGKVKRKFVENVLPKDAWTLERIDETNSYIEVRHSFQNTEYVDSPTNYLLCTHVGREGGNRLIFAYNALYMRFPLTAISTFEEATDFLANNDVKYLIEYRTPTTEDLPIADQIALNSLATYDGITYLEFDSEIEPTFKGEYGTSKVGGYTLESLLTARNNKLEIEAMKATQAVEE